MSDVIVGIKDILVEKGVVTGLGDGSGWRAYLDAEPTTPDECVTIFKAGNWDRANNRFLLDFPSVQVRVRAKSGDAQTARQKIQNVKDALLGIASHDRNGDRWDGILFGTDIISLGADESKRFRYVITFNLIIEPATNALTNRIPLNN